jgi:hypothetical protein
LQRSAFSEQSFSYLSRSKQRLDINRDDLLNEEPSDISQTSMLTAVILAQMCGRETMPRIVRFAQDLPQDKKRLLGFTRCKSNQLPAQTFCENAAMFMFASQLLYCKIYTSLLIYK